MQSWRDKLSRLFGGSQESQQYNSTARSHQPHQDAIKSTDELFARKRSGLSSFLLFFLPTSCSGNEGSNRPTRPMALQPISRRWKLFSFPSKDKQQDFSMHSQTETESNIDDDELSKGNNDNVTQNNCNGAGKIASHDPGEFESCLAEKSVFINDDLFEFLQRSLPNIVKGCKWVLLYSTMKHGISLHTLFRKSADLSGPSLLIVGDMQGAIFGGLLDCPLKTPPKRKYQGTNQTFVFTTIDGMPRLFKPTGANRYFYLCENNLLAFGGGGGFALSLDEDLLHGTSRPCETFGNACLAHYPEFEPKNVELWGFTYSSRYLAQK